MLEIFIIGGTIILFIAFVIAINYWNWQDAKKFLAGENGRKTN